MTSNPASVGPAPDGEGWIEWSGGGNPATAPGRRVDVRFRNGFVDRGGSAAFFRWDHRNECGDIIAYRIAPHPDREAEPRGGVAVPRATLESAMRIIRAFSPQGAAATAIEEALSVSPPVVEGDLGALQAQAPSVPTELEQRLVVALDRLSVTAETVRRMLHRDKERQGPAFREVGIPFTSAIENAKAVIRAYDARHQPTTPGEQDGAENV